MYFKIFANILYFVFITQYTNLNCDEHILSTCKAFQLDLHFSFDCNFDYLYLY